MHAGMDNCGTARSVDCGACSGGQGCVVGECKTPVCSSFNYGSRTNVAAFTQSGIEDSMGAVTPDGKTVLYIKSFASCGSYHLIVADETATAGTYNQQDATTFMQGAGLFVGQDSVSITADALTVITTTTNRKAVAAVKRPAVNSIAFGTPSQTDFAAINSTIGATDPGQILAPNLSADGLEFFYTVTGYSGADVDKNGYFHSVRTSTTVPFSAPTKLTGPITMQAGLLAGVSSDRLAVFIYGSDFLTHVFTRTSTSKEFEYPDGGSAAPTIPGWSHKPLADCSKLIGMYSPGGCANEDVVSLTRQ
jgi:hypothetical protein